jgi:hypothetical protein
MFLPGVLMLNRPRQWKWVAGSFLLCSMIMIGLFWPGIQNGFHSLFIYATNWEFAGFAFRTLRNVLNSGTWTRIILAAAFFMIAGTMYFRCDRGRGGALKQIRARNALPVFQTFYAVSVGFLLLTPTLHPWYALYLAAFLPFAAGPAGMVLSWSVFLGYRVVIGYGLTGKWLESDLMPLLIASGPAAAFIASLLLSDSTLPPRLQNFWPRQGRPVREPSN